MDRSLKRVCITGLLGQFEHEIEFKSDNSLLILHGPNGVGKTKALEIINQISNCQLELLCDQPFLSVVIEYFDAARIEVQKSVLEVDAGALASLRTLEPYSKLRIKTVTAGGVEKTFQYFNRWEGDSVNSIRRILMFASRDSVKTSEGSIGNTGIESTLVDFLGPELEEEFGISNSAPHGVSYINRLRRAIMQSSNEALSYLNEYMEGRAALLIETQRIKLFPREDESERVEHGSNQVSRSAIRDLSKQMVEIIGNAQKQHSDIAQKKDRSFPKRVLEMSDHATMGENEESIRRRYDKQLNFRTKLDKLVSLNIEESLSLPNERMESWQVALIKLYLEDGEEKLAPFQTIVEKVELLKSIINEKFLAKTLEVTAGDGLVVRRINDNEEIPLEKLSSGEQHELIMVFNLLFDINEHSLVMIDEPEISLHVAWQTRFLDDVVKISEISGFSVLVATHSPEIINGRWHSTLHLGPEMGGCENG